MAQLFVPEIPYPYTRQAWAAKQVEEEHNA